MRAAETTAEEGGVAHGALWRVMGPISGTVIMRLFTFVFYMCRTDAEEAGGVQ